YLTVTGLIIVESTPATSSLSLHDALPISAVVIDRRRGRCPPPPSLSLSPPPPRGPPRRSAGCACTHGAARGTPAAPQRMPRAPADRKSTRLNSSHVKTSYAVF